MEATVISTLDSTFSPGSAVSELAEIRENDEDNKQGLQSDGHTNLSDSCTPLLRRVATPLRNSVVILYSIRNIVNQSEFICLQKGELRRPKEAVVWTIGQTSHRFAERQRSEGNRRSKWWEVGPHFGLQK